ncbi:MAG: 1-acyl-sn-glycerol-3-phosphate acyltransferase [Firmicutes bacterium]|nr:1-acyl-sn-glycerol-3-phosphate acyltransferase [Bacillota bacterium]
MKDPILYKILRPIIKVLFLLIFRPKIIGKENIPKKGRVIIAGNHMHNYDCIFLIACTKRCIRFIAKHNLVEKKFSGRFFKWMGIIPVNRITRENKGAIAFAEKLLENDKVIGIFPEGTVNQTDEVIIPFKIGTVKMAQETNSQIVPFALTGQYKVFNNELKIIFGKPYKLSHKSLDEENKILMKKVSELLKGVNDDKN